MTVMSANPLQKHDRVYARHVDVVFDTALYIILTSSEEKMDHIGYQLIRKIIYLLMFS